VTAKLEGASVCLQFARAGWRILSIHLPLRGRMGLQPFHGILLRER
jgi:hypothetical protein